MRIALLNPTFWPEVERGSERIIAQLASDLAARGDEPRVITSHPAPRPATSSEYGYPVTRMPRPPEKLLARRAFTPHLTHLPLSYLALARGGEELAHAFYPTDAAAAIRWAERSGGPTVFSYMGLPRREVLASKRLALSFVARAVNESSEVVALSEAAAAGMERWLGRRPRVIYPGGDLELFSPGGERSPVPTIACAAATDDSRKRVDLLARAFALVRRERRDARLLLVKPRSSALADELGALSDGIEFYAGPPATVADVFRSAWVSAIASYGEAFGLVVVESLACGTPVAGTRDGGIPEIVDGPEVGRLFEREADERAVAKALLESLELSEDPATPGRCRARAEQFSNARCTAGHLELYRELLASTS